MPLTRWLRSSAALYALPLMGVYLMFTLTGELPNLDDNWPGATVLATAATVMAVTPVCAAVAAWEGTRLRQGGVFRATGVRSPITVLAWSAAPVAGAAVLGMVTAFAVVTAEMPGVPGGPDLLILATALLVMAAWTMAGMAAGRYLPPAVGIPLLLVGTWLWFAYPSALEPLWLRHLTGMNLAACCATGEVFDRRALAAQSLLAVSIAVAAYLGWASARRSATRTGAIVLVPALGLGLAAFTVRDLGPEAGRPRAGGLVCTVRQGIEVCVWRERRSRLAATAAIVAPAAKRISVAGGVAMPRRITEGAADGAGTWNVVAGRDSTSDDIVFSLVTGLLPAGPPRCAGTGSPAWDIAYVPVTVWLAERAGVSKNVLATKAGPEAVAVVKGVLALPQAQQRRWFRHNLAALRRCDLSPVGIPAS